MSKLLKTPEGNAFQVPVVEETHLQGSCGEISERVWRLSVSQGPGEGANKKPRERNGLGRRKDCLGRTGKRMADTGANWDAGSVGGQDPG